MKNVKTASLLAAAILAAFVAPATFAQAATTDTVATSAPGPGGSHNPAQMIEHRITKMNAVLTLNSAQQSQIRTILTNQETVEQGFRTSMHAAHANLKTAIQNDDAASIETLSQQLGAVTGQSIAAHAKAEAAIYAALSPEQQTKAAQVPELLGEGGGPGGPGGWGHGGGPR
jgi:Spy/CpxP family protein refolding chaperone